MKIKDKKRKTKSKKIILSSHEIVKNFDLLRETQINFLKQSAKLKKLKKFIQRLLRENIAPIKFGSKEDSVSIEAYTGFLYKINLPLRQYDKIMEDVDSLSDTIFYLSESLEFLINSRRGYSRNE